jgi:hypothetical protein
MSIKLLPNQIPLLWESIKFAATKADRVNEKDLPFYLNRLLADLLSDKAQCFIRITPEHQLRALAITRFIQDVITGEKSLVVSCLYSFEPAQDGQWKSDMDEISRFAKVNGCKVISMYSSNNRVFDIVTMLGFKERFRNFSMEI